MPNLSTPEKLTSDEREDLLATLAGWSLETNRDAMRKVFVFKTFKQAWDFMNKIAVVAEEIGHHPEWFNVYNKVDIVLTTHDCDGLSALDIVLAQKINLFAAKYRRRTHYS